MEGVSSSTLEDSSGDQAILLAALAENLWPEVNLTTAFELNIADFSPYPTYAPVTRRVMESEFVKEGSPVYFTVAASVQEADLVICNETINEIFATIVDTFNGNAESGDVTASIQRLGAENENFVMENVVGGYYATFFNLSYARLYPSFAPTCAPVSVDETLEFDLKLVSFHDITMLVLIVICAESDNLRRRHL